MISLTLSPLFSNHQYPFPKMDIQTAQILFLGYASLRFLFRLDRPLTKEIQNIDSHPQESDAQEPHYIEVERLGSHSITLIHTVELMIAQQNMEQMADPQKNERRLSTTFHLFNS